MVELSGSVAILTTGIFTFVAVFFMGTTSRKKIIQIAYFGYAIGAPFIIFAESTISIFIGMVIQSAVVSKCFISDEK